MKNCIIKNNKITLWQVSEFVIKICMIIIIIIMFLPRAYAEENSFVTFGTYEQDNNYNNGPEPIEWIILDRSEGTIRMISRFALDCRAYHHESGNVGWAESTLRYWLNEVFYSIAFSESEKQMVVESDVNAGSVGTVKDDIYILSADEAYVYWDYLKDFELTDYAKAMAKAQGEETYGKGEEYWWLRTHGTGAGEFKDRKACAWSVGVQPYGHSVEHVNGGIRPVVLIKEN